jgi:tRNA (Thr-GGU) A37 N-methylase
MLVLWWCDRVDTEECRSETTCTKPYTKGQETIEIFATRSPVRPNPIALSVVSVLGVDTASGIIRVAYIDADGGTPVLDIKPYLSCTERVRDVKVAAWSSH